jgi:hypothetical protein
MKRSLLLLPFVLVACTESVNAPSFDVRTAASSNGATSGNKLQCFSGTTDGGFYGGTCTLGNNGAVINTTDGNPNGSYGGVYVQNTNVGGKALADVNKLSFSYSGAIATGGSPRFSIPIDDNGDGVTDGYLFADTGACNNGDAAVGTLDMINDPTCTMYYKAGVYANWAAFITTGFKISGDIPFVIVDQPGVFSITNVQIGRGAAKSKP